MTTIDLEHFDTTQGFRLDATGKPVMCEQDSPVDVESCIVNIVSCPIGGHLGVPTFGIPSPIFAGLPFDATSTLDAIGEWEARAQNLAADDVSTLADQMAGIANVQIAAGTTSQP